jgi:hypothetical protein
MRDDLINMPSEAPAADAWMVLWSMGLDFEYPLAGQTAGEWLQSLNLTSNQWKLINYRAQEAQDHE